VLGKGDLGGWSQGEVADYDSACAVYDQLIAWCTVEIEAERGRQNSDEAVIGELMARSAEYARARRELDPEDEREIARVGHELGGLLKSHYGEVRSRGEAEQL
jgi:hypothetical protein